MASRGTHWKKPFPAVSQLQSDSCNYSLIEYDAHFVYNSSHMCYLVLVTYTFLLDEVLLGLFRMKFSDWRIWWIKIQTNSFNHLIFAIIKIEEEKKCVQLKVK